MDKKRLTLKRIFGVGAAASVVSGSWVKPIVKAIVLPVHAQTSASLALDAIEDVVVENGQSDDPRVQINSFQSSISHFWNIFMVVVNGSNIDPEASFSLLNNPTDQRNDIGILQISPDGGILWAFDFNVGSGNPVADTVPLGVNRLEIKVENPNGESATVEMNVIFLQI